MTCTTKDGTNIPLHPGLGVSLRGTDSSVDKSGILVIFAFREKLQSLHGQLPM